MAQFSNSVEAQLSDHIGKSSEESVELIKQNEIGTRCGEELSQRPNEENNLGLFEEVVNDTPILAICICPLEKQSVADHRVNQNQALILVKQKKVEAQKPICNMESSHAQDCNGKKSKQLFGPKVKGGQNTGGKEIKKKRNSKYESPKRRSEQQNWVDFAQDMVSKEDERAFNNDMRNRNCKIMDELVGSSEVEARKTWDFGKQIGLVGKDHEIVEALQQLDNQVSSLNNLGRESNDEVI